MDDNLENWNTADHTKLTVFINIIKLAREIAVSNNRYLMNHFSWLGEIKGVLCNSFC